MIELSQFMSVSGLAILVGLAVQFSKSYIQLDKVPPFAVLVGVLLAVLLAFVQGSLLTPADLVSQVLAGLFAGLLAVGGYEATLDKIRIGKGQG